MKKKKNNPLEIYGTLGKSCMEKEVLKNMFSYGMTGVVFHPAECSIKDSTSWFRQLYSVSEKLRILPDLIVDDPNFLENFSYYTRYPITGIAVRDFSHDDHLLLVKNTLLSHKLIKIRLFAVIENREDIHALPMILPHCDAAIIDRSSLLKCVSVSCVPALESEAVLICRRTGTPFLLSGELLSSMTSLQTPTLSDTSDIFHGILQGTSGFILTDAAATGKYPEKAMETLINVAWEAKRFKMSARFL